jgi:hypothetical protein
MLADEHGFMSVFGLSFGHRLNASAAASVKISRFRTPSRLPNLDIPAPIMLTNGLPFKPKVTSFVSL